MEKLVLVTGSGRGLGATIAQTFADQNFQVAINYSKSKDQAETLASTLGKSVEAFEADIKDRSAVEKMLESIHSSFGQTPNIIVNNAMTDYVFNGDLRQKAQEISWEEIQNHIDVSIKGSLNVIQACLPGMKEKNFGRIINVGTNLFQNPVVPYHDYIIAKGGLLALTRSFAKDLGEFGITVNMVSGGLLKVTDASAATPDEVFDAIASMTPLQQVTSVQDFADALLFFATESSRAVTGQTLTVDGGLTFN
jgi:3-oxoacyl-[acyl-carrier protein] reductase